MILESFFVLLLLFAGTQYVAWRNLLRGRAVLGFMQFALMFALADLLLLLHFVAQDHAGRWQAGLWLFWGIGLASIFEYLFHAWRARRTKFLEAQARSYAAALDAYLRKQDLDAMAGFRRCCRRDPWDAPAALMLGFMLAEKKPRSAKRWLSRARARAEDSRVREEIEEELRCLMKPRPQRKRVERSSLHAKLQTSSSAPAQTRVQRPEQGLQPAHKKGRMTSGKTSGKTSDKKAAS